MARILDLNTIQESLLDVTLRDSARTVVHLDIPNEALVGELERLGPELKQLEAGDRNAVDMAYDLAARLISCNFDGFKTDGPELKTRFGMHLVAVLTFFSGYMSAINELVKKKN